MMKFFRKHMKKILAVSMCLLLISWLGGSALETLMRPDLRAGVIATSVAGDITGKELNRVRLHTRCLERLALDWRRPLGQLQRFDLDELSWLLLQKEARRMGIHSSKPYVDTVLRQHREDLGRRGLRAPTAERVAFQLNVKPAVVYDAAKAFADVRRYGEKMAQAGTVSMAEVRRRAADVFNQVEVKAVVWRAEMFENPAEVFPETEMREQFDKYKNQKRSGTGLNFGYVLPPRVKVQYAKIDPQRIEETLSIDQQKLEWEANRYWRGHKQDPAFRRPPEEGAEDDAGTQPADGDGAPTTQPDSAPATQPSSAPAEGAEEEFSFFTKWVEAKEVAIREVRRKHAVQRAEAIANWLREQTSEPWYHAEVNTNGYKTPVEMVQQMGHYAQILAGAPAGLPGVEGVTISTTDWISPENVRDVPSIGSALLANPSGPPITFTQVVFNVEGLATIPTGDDAAGVDLQTYLALYQTCPYAMSDVDGNIYVFRPVELDGERPARELDEVRDRVVADLRFARAYEEAQAAAKGFQDKALEGGLQAAWEADTSLQEKIKLYNETVDEWAREAGLRDAVSLGRRLVNGEPVENVREIGEVNEAFIEACFEMQNAGAAESRLRVLAIPESGTVVVAEWIKESPLDEQKLKLYQPTVARMLGQQRMVDYMWSWLDPKQIKARNQFQFKRGG